MISEIPPSEWLSKLDVNYVRLHGTMLQVFRICAQSKATPATMANAERPRRSGISNELNTYIFPFSTKTDAALTPACKLPNPANSLRARKGCNEESTIAVDGTDPIPFQKPGLLPSLSKLSYRY
jgi:hypothetical protein